MPYALNVNQSTVFSMDLELALDLAKQRASVLWLLSKAYNNEIPSDLREPFYKDHDENDRLKPQITQSLASAELYCLALANIYSDPNYHCLNHYGIMQILQRKGVYMVEPNDASLTETVLIQNAPIKMSAHMVIIEAIMTLYIKEVLIPEKVAEVVSRFSYIEEDEIPDDLEEVAIFWINKCCVRLKQVMQRELNADESTRDEPTPTLPMLEELTDLSDGCCLAALLSFYCPDHLKWQEIALNKDMSLADSIYNLQLVQFFCEEKLPFNCCFLTLEDFLYLHETIQTNVLAFIADLLFFFEIRPAECVRQPDTQSCGDEIDGEINNGLYYPDLPTPAEMKAKSLQHSSWADEQHIVIEQQTNGSPPQRPPRRSISSAKLANRHKSVSSQQPSDEDEELTRYFSNTDFRGDNEASPEILMINERNAVKTGPKYINSFADNNNRRNIDDNNDVILSTSPHKQSNNNSNHEMSDKSSSQLTNYFSQLAQTNASGTTTRRPSVPNCRKPVQSNQQNLMNSSIVLGTDSPPLPVIHNSSTSYGYKSNSSQMSSQTQPLAPETEPVINIAYTHKSDKTSISSNNSSNYLPPASQSSQSLSSKPIANTSTNSNTFKLNASQKQNSVQNIATVASDQPFYLQQDEDTRSLNIGKEAFLKVIHKNGSQEIPTQEMPNQLPNQMMPQMVPQMMPQMVPNNHMMAQHNTQELMNHQMLNHQMMAPEVMSHQMHGQPMVMTNHSMIAPEYMNQRLMAHQMMNAPQVMHHQLVNHQMMANAPQVMSHQMMAQNPNTYYHMNSQPTNMAGVSIPPQQVFEEYDRQQQQMYSSSPTSKPLIGRTFRVMKPKVMSPDVSEHNSPTRSASEYSDEGFNNYEKSAKSSSSGSTTKEDTTGAENMKDAFFISFDNEVKPKAPKPGLKPKHVKQQQQMRRELNKQLTANNVSQESQNQSSNLFPNGSANVTPVPPMQSPVNSVSPGVGFVIGADLVHPDLSSELEMAKKKETIMLQSLKRRERLEAERTKKERDLAQKREDDRIRRENSERKREDERVKRQIILEQYRHRKAAEEMEKNGGSLSSKDSVRSSSTLVLNRPSRQRLFQKPRPKSLHVTAANIQDYSSLDCNKSRISVDDTDACALLSANSNLSRPESAMSGHSKSSAFVTSPTGHGSHVPPFMYSRFRGPPSDGASDAGSVYTEYTGPKLFVKPSQKSNKILILNAINVVLAGAVNNDTKKKVLEQINSSDSKHYLILFRNAGLQFRAVYTYNPDREEVVKLYGTGPKSVTNEVIERFYKYNSGSKSFAEIQTKHLSVTIDAFIIHNNLWTGKRVIPKRELL
ncbi:unnamed protein product [Medioppia subpectinata]|uniref:Patronin n=1 Tax=Medioppia subpectinata TaxID=1979941 RepID=A0A7R9KTE2_9ACAR|nr:unnamed protein product [Medioppia subpectinata]CAG2108321.1 unnamed protein product [Medioppia subpectinata]